MNTPCDEYRHMTKSANCSETYDSRSFLDAKCGPRAGKVQTAWDTDEIIPLSTITANSVTGKSTGVSVSAEHNAPKRAIPALRKFYAIPRLHQDWDDAQHERKVGWSEAFFDLLFVPASMNVAHHFHQDVTWQEVAVFMLYYSLFHGVWLQHVKFHTRFHADSLLFDCISLLNFLGTLGMVLTCRFSDKYIEFSTCLAVAYASYAMSYLLVAFKIPRARTKACWYAGSFAVKSGLSAAAALFSFRVFVGLSIVNVAIGWAALGPCSTLFRTFVGAKHALPLHVEHTAERMGLITMIFIGESVVTIGLQELNDAQGYFTSAMAGILIWALHVAYANCHPDKDEHALNIGRLRGLLWTSAHWLLGASFLGCGAGLRLILEFDAGSITETPHRLLLASSDLPDTLDINIEDNLSTGVPIGASWLLCSSYALSLTLVAIARATHYMLFKKMPEREISNPKSTAWWMLVFTWPQMAYVLPFVSKHLTAQTLLGFLVLHACLFILIECGFTHLKSIQLETILPKEIVKQQQQAEDEENRLLHDEIAHENKTENIEAVHPSLQNTSTTQIAAIEQICNI